MWVFDNFDSIGCWWDDFVDSIVKYFIDGKKIIIIEFYIDGFSIMNFYFMM